MKPLSGCLHYTRSVEVPLIREQRLSLVKRIVGVEPELEEDQDFELTNLQFIIASILYQTNVYHTVNFIDILVRNTGVLVFIAYFVVEIFISLPLITLFMFMSSYSKKGFIKFWDCVPLFAGLGYSTLLCRITYAIFQVHFMTPAFLLFIKSLKAQDVIKDFFSCKYDTEGICYPMNADNPINASCPTMIYQRGKNETVYLATQYHYRFQIMRYDRYQSALVGLNHEFIFTALFIWCLVFSISIFGIQRIARMMLNLQFILSFLTCSVVVYGLILTKDPIVTRPMDNNSNQIDFWVEMLIHATDIIVISDIIYLGTLKPKALSPIKAGIQVGIGKYIFFVSMMVYTQRCSQLVLGHYKMMDPRCLIMFGHDVLFAFIPDVLYRVRFGVGHAMLWYLVIFWTNVNMLILTTIACVTAIIEKFERLRKYRALVFFSFCTTCFLGNFYFCSNLSVNTIYTFRHHGDIYYSTICLIVFNFALMFIYSTKRIVEDYTFSYGAPPPKYWIAAWQTAPIVALFSFIFMIYQIAHATKIFIILGAVIWSYIHCALLITPVFIQFLSKCCAHVKSRTLCIVTKPSDSWGPFNHMKRQIRRYYYPQRDERYRNNVIKCQHTCISNSAKYYEEHKKQMVKWHKLCDVLKDVNDDSIPKMTGLLLDPPE